MLVLVMVRSSCSVSMPPVITIIGASVIGIDIGQSRGDSLLLHRASRFDNIRVDIDGPPNWRPASSAAMGDMLLMPE